MFIVSLVLNSLSANNIFKQTQQPVLKTLRYFELDSANSLIKIKVSEIVHWISFDDYMIMQNNQFAQKSQKLQLHTCIKFNPHAIPIIMPIILIKENAALEAIIK